MSTTNPNPGDTPTPGAGREWPEDATNLDRPDDHGGGGMGADPVAIRRGHEEDVTDVRPIWAIPIAVVLFILLGLGAAAGTFMYFMNRPADPLANPVATARGEAGMNERLGRLGRAGQGTELTDQPRLEGLRRREGDGMTTSRPPLPLGNSPEFHPEALRASLQPQLQSSGWVEAGKVARLSIDEAMALSLKGHLFPVRKDPVKLSESYQQASMANSGRWVAPAAAAPPHAKAGHKDH